MESFSDYSTVIDVLKNARRAAYSPVLAVATEILVKRSILDQERLFYCDDIFWKSDFFICVNLQRLYDLIHASFAKKYKPKKCSGPRAAMVRLSAQSLGLGKYVTTVHEIKACPCEAISLPVSELVSSGIVPEFVGIPDDPFECASLALSLEPVDDVVVGVGSVDIGRCDTVVLVQPAEPANGPGFEYAIPSLPVPSVPPLTLTLPGHDRAIFRPVSPAVLSSDRPREFVDLWSTDWGGTKLYAKFYVMRHFPLDNPQLRACVSQPWAASHLPLPVCSLVGAMSLLRLPSVLRSSPKRVKIKINLCFDRSPGVPMAVPAHRRPSKVITNSYWRCVHIGLKDDGGRFSCWRRRKRRLTFAPPRRIDVA